MQWIGKTILQFLIKALALPGFYFTITYTNQLSKYAKPVI